jgi:serine protease Do
VLVAEVMKESPAAAAGLKVGDIITEFNGGAVKDVTDLQKRVAAVEPGRATPMTVTRDGKAVTLSVKVGEQPSDEALAAAENGSESVLGLTVEPLTPETARQNRLTARRGLLVTEVEPGSAGAEAGIRPGDAIVEVNRQPVSDVPAFQKLVAGLKPGESVPVYLQRGGGRAEYVMLTAPRP